METKEFRKLFKLIASQNGFDEAYNGWFKESEECIFVLNLQRSYFGRYYYLNIKIYVQGVFGKKYVKCKDLVLKEVGHIFLRTPKEYGDALDLDSGLDDNSRTQKLVDLFKDFLEPFSRKALTKNGLIDLEERDEIFVLPAVKEELEKLGTIFVKKSNGLN